MNPDCIAKRRLFCRVFSRGLLLAVTFCGARGQTTQSVALPLLTPTSIVFDSNGLLYIVETNRHLVDRLDTSGTLTPVAGNGTQGFAGDGGPATSAQLDSPQAVALDSSSGNLYIADTHNHRIRRVDAATGHVTTVAGTGTPGFSGDDGPAASARLTLPTALALDQAGNLYFADSGNQRIRKLTLASGTLTTVAGNGTQGNSGDGGLATSAAIDMPSGLAVDSAGNLFLADLHNQRIRRVATDTGIISTLAPDTLLRLPRGLTLDAAGNLFVAETGGHRILRIAPTGSVTTLTGTGTQGFAGDNGPATAALLDRPHATAISPAGLLTLADTGNQRIRQVDDAGIIHTVTSASSSSSTSTLVALTVPASVQYGTGTVTATLTTSTPAAGFISFSEVTNSVNTLLATVPLASNTATFATANLPAGVHTVIASFSGDSTHSPSTSNPSLLTVTPAPATATPLSASVLYGQATPPLSGSLTGILARDGELVTAVFTSAARLLSPAGSYPIAATLTGPSAGNYQLTTAPATLTIQQAPTVTTATASSFAVLAGAPVTLSAKTVSTTQGVPTGRITFLDTGLATESTVADASGNAMVTTALSVGTHTITALYAGDRNFLPSTSPVITEVVAPLSTTLPDFTLSPTGGASQTVPAGAVATYAFNVNVQNGPLNSPILLAANGMPPGGAATFSPTSLPPGGGVSSFTLSIQTRTAVSSRGMVPAGFGLAMCAFVVVGGRRRRGGHARLVLLLASGLAGFSALEGCGGTVGSVLAPVPASSISYPMTVSATTTLPNGSTLQHTAMVTLIVQ